MDNLSSTGQIILICFAVFFVAINLTLFFAIRRNSKGSPMDLDKRRKQLMDKTKDIVKNPWEKEDAGWQELNEQVKKFREQQDAEKKQKS